ncbi:hypothetical protein BHU72_05515 [Desulfuribacillus stibiiarsenatis]|uniref:Uncharacterized protein n=1 Tax=Desulfuribacillus stibiiarsenatis TaxID=1390249 RepID=A0A1E5L523_9FIRM|nr:DUF6544 family protein [Desulfuribacillus stibiiarsenatis]OEH85069.1 hypothetical protein BHU72_05515 [Desulfuribacillus stibiiarsenatis]
MYKYLIGIFVFLILIVSVLVISSKIANRLFHKQVNLEVQEMFDKNIGQIQDTSVRIVDLQRLPLIVQQWLKQSQIIEKEYISSVRSKQTAKLRLKPDQKWMSSTSEQYFTVDKPAFIWKARIEAAPLLHIVGRDMYLEGNGNMLIKVLSLFTVADGKGAEVDQGSLVRYLAEMVWFPTMALSDLITWETVDDRSAKASMTYMGVRAEGIFTFNELGEVTLFEAMRYGDFGGEYRLEKWVIQLSDTKEFHGYRVPTKGEVIWKLPEGDFSWYHFELKDIEFNVPHAY